MCLGWEKLLEKYNLQELLVTRNGNCTFHEVLRLVFLTVLQERGEILKCWFRESDWNGETTAWREELLNSFCPPRYLFFSPAENCSHTRSFYVCWRETYVYVYISHRRQKPALRMTIFRGRTARNNNGKCRQRAICNLSLLRLQLILVAKEMANIRKNVKNRDLELWTFWWNLGQGRKKLLGDIWGTEGFLEW